jgi:hypothetical protein
MTLIRVSITRDVRYLKFKVYEVHSLHLKLEVFEIHSLHLKLKFLRFTHHSNTEHSLPIDINHQ